MFYKVSFKINTDKMLSESEIEKLKNEYQEKFDIKSDVDITIDYSTNLALMEEVKRTKLISLHQKMNEYIQEANNDKTSKARLKELGKIITDMEYEMQECWGFPKKREYHTHWLRPNKCVCPKLDNREVWGHSYYINESCPLHGSEE